MASNIDTNMENGEDFSQDVKADFVQDDQMNGSDQNGDNVAHGEVALEELPPDTGSADAPGLDDDRKLFVGGLSWETTDIELREHFGKFGEIESINVKTDPHTGRSRGFAFIVFKTANSIDKVVAFGDHVINNKKVDPKKAKARHGKIFVGGLTNELSDDEIKNFFEKFGTIVEIERPFDKTKNQRKAFCFVTYESEKVVNELLQISKQTINNVEVDIKRATQKPDAMGNMRGGGRMMRGGGRGRGRGSYGNQNWGNQGYGAYGGYGQSYGGGGYDSYGSGGYDYYSGGSYGGYGGYDYSSYGGNYGKYSSTRH